MNQILVGLLGKGILLSKSPALHQFEAESQNLNLRYKLYDLNALDKNESDLKSLINSAEFSNITGLNITHPFKQSIIPFLDELSTNAEFIGAVNTVVFKGKKLKGYNTDFIGFRDAFKEELGDLPLNKVLILGAGGAGCAVATAMMKLGTELLLIHDIDKNKANLLENKISEKYGHERVSVIDDPVKELKFADGVINATPIGMQEYPGMPLSIDDLRAELWVADIIYFPIETELLKAARKKGCPTMNGGRMAVYQAAACFELFTGIKANKDRMLKYFEASCT
jgi:shikimate dehydrogenase